MAFRRRPDGLVDVDTPMGPLPMAPDVAERIAPTYQTLAERGATAYYGTAAAPNAVTGQPRTDPAPAPEEPLTERQEAIGQEYEQMAQGFGEQDPQGVHPSQLDVQRQEQRDPADPMQQAIDRSIQQKLTPRQVRIRERPAGWKDQQRRIQTKAPASEDVREATQEYHEKELEAATAQQEAAKEQAEWAKHKRAMETSMMRDELMDQAADQQRIQNRRAELEETVKQAKEEVPQLDRDRWDKTGGFGRTLAAIGIALNGMGTAVTGGENQALAMVNQVIEDDLAAQREEIRQAEGEVDDVQNDLAKFNDLYQDPIMAERQARVRSQQSIINEVDNQIANAESDEAIARLQTMRAQLEAQQAQEMDQLMGRGGEMVLNQAYDPGQKGGVRTIGPDVEGALELSKKAGDAGVEGYGEDDPEDIGRRVVITDSSGKRVERRAKDKQQAREIQSTEDTYQTLMKSISRARAMLKDDSTKWSPAKRTEFQAEQVPQLYGMFKQISEGAMSEGERATMKPTIPEGGPAILDPTSKSRNLAKLRAMERIATDIREQKLRATTDTSDEFKQGGSGSVRIRDATAADFD